MAQRRLAVEIDVLRVAPRSLEARDAVRHRDTLSGMACMMTQLMCVISSYPSLIASIGRMPAGMWPCTCRPSLCASAMPAGSQPVERSVELHAGESVGLRLVDERDRFGFARRDIRDLRRVRTLAVDQRRGVDVRHQQLAARDARGDRGSAKSSLPGSRIEVTPIESSCRPV